MLSTIGGIAIYTTIYIGAVWTFRQLFEIGAEWLDKKIN